MRRRLEAGTATDDDAAQMLAALDALFARAGEFVSLETHWRRIHTVTRLLRNGDRATLARLIEGGHNGGPEDDGNVYN
ncbi:MAG TPA: hypothetical protein VKS25_07755 [Solirubrobacteraceae bacterium]|nr:hypothetical protein [Solirubrobacteraceae bacterium]